MLQMSIQDKYNVSRGFDSKSLSDEVLGNWDFNLRNYHYMYPCSALASCVYVVSHCLTRILKHWLG